MSVVSWSMEARADLRRIDQWLTDNASGEISRRMLVDIGERSTLLLDFPLAGPIGDDEERSLRVTGTPYILIYRLRPTGIEILRIRHNRQNWQSPE